MEHVIRELLQIVGCKVKLLQIPARVEASDRFKIEFVVAQVKVFEAREILFAQGRNLRNLVELKVKFLQVFEISELFHANLVISQIKSC